MCFVKNILHSFLEKNSAFVEKQGALWIGFKVQEAADIVLARLEQKGASCNKPSLMDAQKRDCIISLKEMSNDAEEKPAVQSSVQNRSDLSGK